MKELHSYDDEYFQLLDDIELIYEEPSGHEREHRVKEMRAYIRANYSGDAARYLIEHKLKYY